MPDKSGQDSGLQEKLRALEALFSAKLPERLSELDGALQKCLDEPGQTEHLNALHRLLHTMAGSGGTFGFHELGLRARRLEAQVDGLMSGTAPHGQELDNLAWELQDMLRWAAAHPKEEGPGTPPWPPAVRGADAASTRLIYLVDDDALLAEDIAVQLDYFGYEVVVISALGRLATMIAERMPSAIVMDLVFPEGVLAGATEIGRIKEIGAHRVPTIFISTRGNFESRLATVRAGADGYFTKPVDVVALIDRLDVLTVREERRPYRILIVDDDVATAEYYAVVLRGVGMHVNVLRKLSDILRVLGEYRPELVLMDVYMPECSGVDLARLVRQDNVYLDVPIVFLSSEGNLGTQLDAIQSGADDFLTKPIEPAHLISSLTSRVERYRALRGLIMRDSLTGLFNHSAIKEHLMREISRARRSASTLALAMIDLDFFKQVNDSYGHPVGDQVIRVLSRLLQQRLRRGDIIGRYGGEEFVVIMPATSAAAALGVLDQIRETFSKIRHHADEYEFTVTFSAGVADLTSRLDADALFRTADAALYQAKGNGRNRIEVA